MKSKKPNKKEGELFSPGLKESVKKSGFVFIISALMFIAGVMAGRGTFPVTFKHNSLQEELSILKQADSKADIEDKNAISAKICETDTTFKNQDAPPAKKPGAGSVIHKAWKSRKAKTCKSGKKAMPPKEISLKKGIKENKTNQYIVQIAASRDSAYAAEIVAKLKKKGLNAYIIKAKVPGKGIFYRVRVGTFNDQKNASALLDSLKKEKIFGYITKTQE